MANDMRDRLVKLLGNRCCNKQIPCEICEYENFADCHRYALADHLIANDVVRVVRCKDCKHWNNGDCYRIELTRPNDFCSYGERKEQNG